MDQLEGNFSKDWVCAVDIKIEFLKSIPFATLQSRQAVALIWGFFGFKHQVIGVLQRTSHQTRAYIYNARGLPGFVKILEPFQVIKQLTTQELQQIEEYQEISHALFEETHLNADAQLQQIKDTFPNLFLYVLEKLDRANLRKEFIHHCEKAENDPDTYTLYVFCIWLPHLKKLRSQGLLRQGKRTFPSFIFNVYTGERKIRIGGFFCNYKGEMDQNGQAFGHGVATNDLREDITYEGTFKDDKVHGLGNQLQSAQTLWLGFYTGLGTYASGEWKSGSWFGKQTCLNDMQEKIMTHSPIIGLVPTQLKEEEIKATHQRMSLRHRRWLTTNIQKRRVQSQLQGNLTIEICPIVLSFEEIFALLTKCFGVPCKCFCDR